MNGKLLIIFGIFISSGYLYFSFNKINEIFVENTPVRQLTKETELISTPTKVLQSQLQKEVLSVPKESHKKIVEKIESISTPTKVLQTQVQKEVLSVPKKPHKQIVEEIAKIEKVTRVEQHIVRTSTPLPQYIEKEKKPTINEDTSDLEAEIAAALLSITTSNK